MSQFNLKRNVSYLYKIKPSVPTVGNTYFSVILLRQNEFQYHEAFYQLGLVLVFWLAYFFSLKKNNCLYSISFYKSLKIIMMVVKTADKQYKLSAENAL